MGRESTCVSQLATPSTLIHSLVITLPDLYASDAILQSAKCKQFGDVMCELGWAHLEFSAVLCRQCMEAQGCDELSTGSCRWPVHSCVYTLHVLALHRRQVATPEYGSYHLAGKKPFSDWNGLGKMVWGKRDTFLCMGLHETSSETLVCVELGGSLTGTIILFHSVWVCDCVCVLVRLGEETEKEFFLGWDIWTLKPLSQLPKVSANTEKI